MKYVQQCVYIGNIFYMFTGLDAEIINIRTILLEALYIELIINLSLVFPSTKLNYKYIH